MFNNWYPIHGNVTFPYHEPQRLYFSPLCNTQRSNIVSKKLELFMVLEGFFGTLPGFHPGKRV